MDLKVTLNTFKIKGEFEHDRRLRPGFVVMCIRYGENYDVEFSFFVSFVFIPSLYILLSYVV